MSNNYIQSMITISSIGLCIAIIPEFIEIYKEPKKVLNFSLVFLLLKTLFFIILVTALFLKHDSEIKMLLILTIIYTIYYSALLFVYRIEYKKKNRS